MHNLETIHASAPTETTARPSPKRSETETPPRLVGGTAATSSNRADRAGARPRHGQGLHRHPQSSSWTTQGSSRTPPATGASKHPARNQKQPDIPPRTHIKAIRNHLPQHLLLAFDTLEATGIRVGELTSLTWDDLDVAESRARIAERQNPLRKTLGQATPRNHQQDRQPPGPTRGHTPQGDACSPTSATAHSDGGSSRPANTQAHPTTTPTTSDTAGSASPSNEASHPPKSHATSRPRPPSNHPQHLQPRHHPTQRHPPPRLGHARTPSGHTPRGPETHARPRNARTPR